MSIFGLRSNELASSAYKNLSRAQTSLTDNISRLASGLRINKTADDSAGSNVSIRMKNQLVRSVETAKYIGRIALEIRPIGLGNRLTWAI